ncbi:MAG: Na(+)-translocating NADH-quinone reductase subunit C [Proteobacteria bacterium]|nr:Na(+)-translocating NADH-quinone reductase subunit C [Pseudomonadota bacterium]
MSNDSPGKGSPQNEKDSIKNVLVVAVSVCLVCAVIVSAAAVLLKSQRLANKELDRNKNILIAAGLFEQGVTLEEEIDSLFGEFEIRVIDLEEQRLLSDAEVEQAGIDVLKYDQRKAAKNPELSIELSSKEDIASINRRARYSIVYLLRKDGKLDRIVLPIHGYGLWSTLYGFIALRGDGNTVSGITFYEQQETAGLGGEVDNPAWKALWPGKQIYDADHKVALKVIKGTVDKRSPNAKHPVDGLSGATITSRGVQNLIRYWLGDSAFGPVLLGLSGRG